MMCIGISFNSLIESMKYLPSSFIDSIHVVGDTLTLFCGFQLGNRSEIIVLIAAV